MARPRGDIDVRVVRAAHARFLRDGVDGASLRAIARDADTSVGMVYYYFPTKDDLFAAVVEEVYGAFLDDVTRLLEPRAPLEARLARLFTRLGEATVREREVLRIVLREALASSARLDRVVARVQRGHLPLLVAALRDGVDEGAVDPDLPTPVALVMTVAVGVAAQIMSRELAPRLPFSSVPQGKELADLLATRVLRGIGPGTPPLEAAKRSTAPKSRDPLASDAPPPKKTRATSRRPTQR